MSLFRSWYLGLVISNMFETILSQFFGQHWTHYGNFLLGFTTKIFHNIFVYPTFCTASKNKVKARIFVAVRTSKEGPQFSIIQEAKLKLVKGVNSLCLFRKCSCCLLVCSTKQLKILLWSFFYLEQINLFIIEYYSLVLIKFNNFDLFND